MKALFFLACAMATLAGVAQADDRIYRCGNEYTNTATEEQAKNCKLMSGGNVTVIQATKIPASLKPSSAPRVDGADQRSRDSDARMILETELKKALARRDELLKQYNGGDPEKQGDELRNNQKYLDRVVDMKASIDRNDSDIAGIRRELDRLSAAQASASGQTSSGK